MRDVVEAHNARVEYNERAYDYEGVGEVRRRLKEEATDISAIPN